MDTPALVGEVAPSPQSRSVAAGVLGGGCARHRAGQHPSTATDPGASPRDLRRGHLVACRPAARTPGHEAVVACEIAQGSAGGIAARVGQRSALGMFASARSHGAVLSALGNAPDGSAWTYADYPQGFHALVATLSEMTMPTVRAGPDLLVSYTQMTTAVVVLGVLLLTAALLSLPGVRARPVVAVPAVVFVWTAYLWEPGQKMIADGFANFWLGTVAVASALLLALGRRGRVVEVAAVAGLVVAASQAWTPLVLLAAPAVLVSLWRVYSHSARPVARFVPVVIWVLAAIICLRTVLMLVATVPVSKVVSITGPIHGTSPLPTFVLTLAGAYLFISYRGWVRLHCSDDATISGATQVTWYSLLPAMGLLPRGAPGCSVA